VNEKEPLGAVITGATRGFGFALAQELVEGGDRVVICGRDEKRLAAAAAALKERARRQGAVYAIRCDVSNGHDVAALGDFAAEQLGTVHLWVNNAGAVTGKGLLDETPAEEIVEAVGTNVLGSLLCCREAIRVMRRQPGLGGRPAYHIFNLGFSDWGRRMSATACTHKATKSALRALTEALSSDLAKAGVTSIGVHNLSPGMVLTDLLLKDTTATARTVFNALAEEPETVAAALAPRLRDVQGSNTSVDFQGPIAFMLRALRHVPQVMNGGGRFFNKQGERVRVDGQRYTDLGARDVLS